MFSDFPNLHPLVVHFPIVLILLSAVLQGLLVFKGGPHLRRVTLWMMGAAFASALVASKVFHAHVAELPPLADAIYQDHEKYAAYTLWISGLTLLLRGIGDFFHFHRRAYESLVLVPAVLSAVFLSLTGHRGAQLVHLEGVGPQGNLVMSAGHEHGDIKPGQQAKPAGRDTARMSAMDHTSGHGASHSMAEPHSMPGKKPAVAGKDLHGHQQVPASDHPGGMDHTTSHKPGATRAGKPGMSAMHHPEPANPPKGKAKENMAGMDHSQMSRAGSKKPVPDHAAMGHGNTPAPARQAAANHGAGMAGMDHGEMPATGHQPPTDNKSGIKGRPAATDRYGRPLIYPAEPYDNNPVRQQVKSSQ